MKLLFGKNSCIKCKQMKESFDRRGVAYRYFDLDTPDGLTEAALRGIIGQCEKSLPVVVEEDE